MTSFRSRSDLMSMMSYVGDQHDNVREVVENRTIYRDEKHCLNCTHLEECWPEGNDVEESYRCIRRGLPTMFRLTTNNWNRTRFIAHFKAVAAQVCGVFENSDTEIRRRSQESAVARGETDWDTEQNKEKK